jgi:hypothetical protein
MRLSFHCEFVRSDLLAVLVFRDALADPILLSVDAALLRFRQMPVVCGHIFLFTVLDIGLAVLEIRSLLRIEFPAADTLPDALLLVFFTLIYFIHARMTGIDNARARSRSGG